MTRAALLVLGAACAALAGCKLELVREHPLGCRRDEAPMIRDTFYFGRAVPGGGQVDEAAWAGFENAVLARAFPDGYTVLDAHGRWRGNDGIVLGEDSRVVIVVHPDDAASAKAVREVADTYRARFRQEAVLREAGTVCVSFHRR